jgi:hypothetical protein
MSTLLWRTEHLLIDFKESLERQVHALGREMSEGFARIETKFDTQAARLDWQITELRVLFDKLEKRDGDQGRAPSPPTDPRTFPAVDCPHFSCTMLRMNGEKSLSPRCNKSGTASWSTLWTVVWKHE